ncbi:hypothetical protein L873DRAFT_1794440 [Choiromyces venosus 120613-1]|uniref:Uncharacterized protein n=1 Tax=Choiromyces venosus 120613-1 TaxID=1336337 RepID=A0A3N4J6U9_9PEZI|nr:hypothetical protein L873DRAFT_1794440 [Choiromyces venosus 120613-1]
MTTTTPHPPTTLHGSTPLSPRSAESFLSAFLADASRKPNQNEIVLTNLLRVQQALAGVYVPPPELTAAEVIAAEAEVEQVLTKGEAGSGEIVSEGGKGEYGEVKVDEGGMGRRVEIEVVPKVVTTEEGDREKEKEKRRAEKKARRREERRGKEEGEKERKKVKKEKVEVEE